jgi:hypothetical protein
MGVSAIVAVAGGVHVGNGVGWGAGRLAKSVMSVTMIVPETPINAAIIFVSIDLFSLDISAPISKKFWSFYAIFNTYSIDV